MSTRQTPQRARLARAIVGRTMACIMIFTAAFAVAFAAFDAIVKPGLSNFLYFEVMGGDGGASWRLYDALTKRGVEVIWDDRPVSAGVMFSDADLFGVPVRVVVSPKGLKNGTIEISSRDKSLQEKRPIDEAVDFVYNYVCSELAKLECRL